MIKVMKALFKDSLPALETINIFLTNNNLNNGTIFSQQLFLSFTLEIFMNVFKKTSTTLDINVCFKGK